MKYIHTGIFLKFKCGQKKLLELNVEPQIAANDEAFLAINDVKDVILRAPGDIYIDNECLSMKDTNGVNVLAAVYTWARVKDVSVQYMVRTFNCDHMATYFMVGQTECTTFTTVSSVVRCPGLISRYNYPDGQLSKFMLENIHKKNV